MRTRKNFKSQGFKSQAVKSQKGGASLSQAVDPLSEAISESVDVNILKDILNDLIDNSIYFQDVVIKELQYHDPNFETSSLIPLFHLKSKLNADENYSGIRMDYSIPIDPRTASYSAANILGIRDKMAANYFKKYKLSDDIENALKKKGSE